MAALRESISARSTNHVTVDNDLPKDKTPVGVGVRHFAAAFQKVKPSVSKKVRSQLTVQYQRVSSSEKYVDSEIKVAYSFDVGSSFVR